MKQASINDLKDAAFYILDLKNYIDAYDFKYFDPKSWESEEEHKWIMDAYSRSLRMILEKLCADISEGK